MRSVFGRRAFGVGLALIFLAGCGAQGIVGVGPDAMPPIGRASAKHGPTNPLLFVTEFTRSTVLIYNPREKNPNPRGAITEGINAPVGDCIDAEGTLYVLNYEADHAGSVTEYHLGHTRYFKRITRGINRPGYCAIDSSGNLWVTSFGGVNVTEYLKGTKEPTFVITVGLSYPVGISIDPSGNVYVANSKVGSAQNVQVYPPGVRRLRERSRMGSVRP